jgi:hypothetical protein
MTQRHNWLANFVKEALAKFLQGDIRSEICENMTLNGERLSEPNQNLIPDIVSERREKRRERELDESQANQETEKRI